MNTFKPTWELKRILKDKVNFNKHYSMRIEQNKTDIKELKKILGAK